MTSVTGKYLDGKPLFNKGLLARLDMKGFLHDSCARVMAETPVLPGESDLNQRMRQMSYMHLTRFVQTLLDRMSMAVGLNAWLINYNVVLDI